MSYFTAFDISASGMQVQSIRLQTVAMNLANVNSTGSADGGPYQPLQVVVAEKNTHRFDSLLQKYSGSEGVAGAQVIDVQPLKLEPRRVYEPEHPHADKQGFVAYPNINPASEMMVLMQATRAYEANVQAFNAAKMMSLEALKIGG